MATTNSYSRSAILATLQSACPVIRFPWRTARFIPLKAPDGPLLKQEKNGKMVQMTERILDCKLADASQIFVSCKPEDVAEAMQSVEQRLTEAGETRRPVLLGRDGERSLFDGNVSTHGYVSLTIGLRERF